MICAQTLRSHTELGVWTCSDRISIPHERVCNSTPVIGKNARENLAGGDNCSAYDGLPTSVQTEMYVDVGRRDRGAKGVANTRRVFSLTRKGVRARDEARRGE